MVLLKKFCFCLSPRTGTVILGCVSIMASVLSMIPQVLVLKDLNFYAAEYVKQQILEGKDYVASDVSRISEGYSRNVLATAVATDVMFTFASISLITGVVTERRHLLVPWLFLTFLAIFTSVIFILGLMFKFKNELSFFVFVFTAPFLATAIYMWLVVHTTFNLIRKDTRGVPQPTTNVSTSGIQGTVTETTSWGIGGVNQPERKPASHFKCQYQYLPDSLVPSENLVLSVEPPSFGTVASDEAKSVTLLTQSASMSSFDSAKSSIRNQLRRASPPPAYETVAKNADNASNSSNSEQELGKKVRNEKKNEKQKRSQSSDNLELVYSRRTSGSSTVSSIGRMSGPTILLHSNNQGGSSSSNISNNNINNTTNNSINNNNQSSQNSLKLDLIETVKE